MDMTQIQSAIALVSTAIGMTNQAASTADLIKKLFSSREGPDDGEASKLLNALATDLTTANVMNMQLSEALKTLSRELQRQDEFEREKSRYEMFATSTGDIVFALKAELANGQPTHFICPVCMNRDKLITYVTGDGAFKRCQTDSNHMYHFRKSPRPEVKRGSGW
ncbi:hypothetical protein [Rhizobium sp. GN54]|uniref:hypothetical protein n=1 Tax=Rhizobium sp. GN54 TaxID=2898150 RepID=UPI001E546F1F|nr:hypothetical protein [Rhizobium sp. GN54]MCD2185224.1 hypothetical protein [Rhizobium sp. GN54]